MNDVDRRHLFNNMQSSRMLSSPPTVSEEVRDSKHNDFR